MTDQLYKSAIVNAPTEGDVHVNRPLTNFSQKFLQTQEMFVGTVAFPNMPVASKSDEYFIFSREDFYRDGAKERADATESAGGGFDLDTDTYFARVQAFHKDVSDRQRANQDSAVQLDESTTQFVMHQLLIRRERLFTEAFFNTGLWATEVTGVTGAPANATEFQRWDEDGSDPIVDVRTAVREVHRQTGYRPNKMLIGREAYDALLDNAAVLDRIIGGATVSETAMVMKTKLAELFELEKIYVMDSVFNNAKDGAPEDTQFIGGNNALVYYAPDGVGLNEPTAGAQFSWTGFFGATPNGIRIKRFRVETVGADRIEGEMAFDYKIVADELGYFFAGATS